jgi:hypothetical protein
MKDSDKFQLKFKRFRLFLITTGWIFVFLFPAAVYLSGFSIENLIGCIILSSCFGMLGAFESIGGFVAEYDHKYFYCRTFGFTRRFEYSEIKKYSKVPLLPIRVVKTRFGEMHFILLEWFVKNPEVLCVLHENIVRASLKNGH